MRSPRPRSISIAHRGHPAEHCPRCLQTYVYEVELRCVDCDSPVCPFCVVHSIRETVRTTCCGGCQGDE